jgi:diaminopimelate dehydrogenase
MGINTADAFDMHENIMDVKKRLDITAKKHGVTAIISAGWDPGLFSLNRLYMSAILPDGESYAFWGKRNRQVHHL